MPKTVQIRDLDDDIYAALRRRAVEAGLTVPELLRREATRLATRPTVEEWLARTRRRPSGIDRADVLAADPDHAAPHVVDIEVVSVIRLDHRLGRLDDTASTQAVDDLRDWPGERFGHQPLLDRLWELRATVRGWDAAHVALAEVLDATLLTLDARLAAATGPRCRIDVIT